MRNSYVSIDMYSCWFACERTMKTITINVERCCCYCCCCVRVYLPWRNHSTLLTYTHVRFSFCRSAFFSISRALFYVLLHAHIRTCYVIAMKRATATISNGRLEAEYQNRHQHRYTTRNTHTQTHAYMHTHTNVVCARASVKQEEACKLESHHCQLCG